MEKGKLRKSYLSKAVNKIREKEELKGKRYQSVNGTLLNVWVKDKSKQIRDKLIVNNLYMVMKIAGEICFDGDTGDLIQEGNIILTEFVDYYLTNLKNTNATRFSVCLYKTLKSKLTQVYLSKYSTILSGRRYNDKDEDLPEIIKVNWEEIHDVIDDTIYTVHERILLRIEIDKLLDCLTNRERFIIKKFYGIEQAETSLEDIGLKLQISKERCRQILVKSQRKCLIYHNKYHKKKMIFGKNN